MRELKKKGYFGHKADEIFDLLMNENDDSEHCGKPHTWEFKGKTYFRCRCCHTNIVSEDIVDVVGAYHPEHGFICEDCIGGYYCSR